MDYLYLKVIHLFAVVIFLGNIITGLFWMAFAVKTKDVKIINHTMKGIIASDRLFTIPGVIVILAGGILAAVKGNLPLLGTGWIAWSLILFGISGLAFSFFVAPLQKKLGKFTENASGDFDWSRFRKMHLAWELWGLVALLTPLAAMVMMILKRPV